MRKIGVSLVDLGTNAELQSWTALPQSIVHDGETRVGAIVGALIGASAQLVERFTDSDVPFGNPEVDQETPVFDGQKVVVSRTYKAPDLDAIKSVYVTAIKSEAQRLIIALTGKATLLDCMIKQSNANMRATELNDKRISGQPLTAQEEAEAEALRAIANKIKAIRTHSNALEAEVAAIATAENLQVWEQHDWPVLP